MFEEYQKIIMDWVMTNPEYAAVIACVVVFVLLFLLRGISFFRFFFRWFQRLIILAALVGLGLWLFWIGREHQIYLDNKTLNDYSALEQVNVSLNGGEVVELMKRDRDMKKVVGPKFELKAEVFDENGEIINTITKTIEPKCSKDIMISLPALAGGAESFILPSPR